jgi:predicted dienelactone hydrolase
MTAALALVLIASPAYDPLAVPKGDAPFRDETWRDADRSRDVPVRIYLPSGSPAPIAIFSHGLGGSRQNNVFLAQHLAKRGYLTIFIQHPGSDESVWRGAPVGDRMNRMAAAASGENFRLRVQDVEFVLDEIEKRSKEAGSILHGKADVSWIGMSGHSFGAVTTQAVSGQWFPTIGQAFTDERIDVAVMYSPSAPPVGDASRYFGSVKVPWLLMTGTLDGAPIGNTTIEDRFRVFPALPKGDKYELVLFEAEHSAFSERALPGDAKGRNPNHHKAMLALTTAFYDAYLRRMPEAKAWLQGEGAKAILEPKDTWKLK